jgi:hypothetical protein
MEDSRESKALIPAPEASGALLSHAVAPAGDRGAIERQGGVPEEFLAAEILIIRVLDPPCAHHPVAEIEGVLENGKGSGGRPGRSVYTAPNFSSRKRQSIAFRGFSRSTK